MKWDKRYLKYCQTDRQREVLSAVLVSDTISEAAKILGIARRNVHLILARIKTRAALKGFSPDEDLDRPVPPGFEVTGVSTYRDGQWLKIRPERETEQENLLTVCRELAEEFRGSIPEIPYYRAPLTTREDVVTAYPMGDPHIGMYAWAEEAGEKFNLEIAEQNLVSAADKLVSLAPESNVGLVINLGDYIHINDTSNKTPKSGHPLDVDGRLGEVLRCGVRTLCRIINRAAEKHKVVYVFSAYGNHDPTLTLLLQMILEAMYSENPRVKVEPSYQAFQYYQFGKVLLGITHGDKAKPDQLGQVMAADKPKEWGETRHRYWYCGHIHHTVTKEVPGCLVESFRTFAPRDNYAQSYGYRSRRDMKAIVLHKEHGEISRYTVTPEMLV